MLLRYGFFYALFLLPMYPSSILVSLEMARKVVIIENKFGFLGIFKTIYPLPFIQRFIMDKFKVVKAQNPWIYDPLDVFMETLKMKKKCLIFKNQLCPIQINQIRKLKRTRCGILFHYKEIG